MKTKFGIKFTAAAAAVVSVLSLTAPAKADMTTIDELIDALAPFTPTIDGQELNTVDTINGRTLTGFVPDSPLNIISDTDNLEVFFLGEAAGQKNELSFSRNGAPSEVIWDSITALPEISAVNSNGDPIPGNVGTFNVVDTPSPRWLKVGTGASLGAFSAGDTLDFTVTKVGDSSQTFSLSTDGSNFRGYQLKGFEEWLILGMEDNFLDVSDKDYNDVVIALKLADVPEPATTVALFGVAAASLGLTRRKNAAK